MYLYISKTTTIFLFSNTSDGLRSRCCPFETNFDRPSTRENAKRSEPRGTAIIAVLSRRDTCLEYTIVDVSRETILGATHVHCGGHGQKLPRARSRPPMHRVRSCETFSASRGGANASLTTRSTRRPPRFGTRFATHGPLSRRSAAPEMTVADTRGHYGNATRGAEIASSSFRLSVHIPPPPLIPRYMSAYVACVRLSFRFRNKSSANYVYLLYRP